MIAWNLGVWKEEKIKCLLVYLYLKYITLILFENIILNKQTTNHKNSHLHLHYAIDTHYKWE